MAAPPLSACIGRQPRRGPDGAPVHHERHRPEQTPLYRGVQQQHAMTFIAQAEDAAGADLPLFVEVEFKNFLERRFRRTSSCACAKATATTTGRSPSEASGAALAPLSHRLRSSGPAEGAHGAGREVQACGLQARPLRRHRRCQPARCRSLWHRRPPCTGIAVPQHHPPGPAACGWSSPSRHRTSVRARPRHRPCVLPAARYASWRAPGPGFPLASIHITSAPLNDGAGSRRAQYSHRSRARRHCWRAP